MQYSISATVALQLFSLMGMSQAVTTFAPYANTTTTVASSTTAATQISGIPVASLCPAVNGKVIVGPDSLNWTVQCASDSWTGAYGVADTSTSYLGCIASCDAQPKCNGFTYQANSAADVNGVGAGKCWLKTSVGAYKSAPGNFIVASKPSSPTSSSSSTTTTSTSTSASTSPTAAPSGMSCPSWNGLNYTTTAGRKYTVQCGIDHFGGNLADFSTSDFTKCIETCGDNSACVDVSYVSGRCWMKSAIGFSSNSPSVWGAILVPTGNHTLPVVV